MNDTNALRVASTKRTWKPGETTEHFWVEVKPDTWQEVSRQPTVAEADEFRAERIRREANGGMMYLSADTRYLRQMSDDGTFKVL